MIRKRICTRPLHYEWPFLYSVVNGKLYRNVPAEPGKVETTKARRVRVGGTSKG
jgi:hypothetical protein